MATTRSAPSPRAAARRKVTVRGLDAAVTGDAALDRVPPSLARLAFWLPILGGVALLVLRLLADQDYRWLNREDHPVEWAQFTLLLVAWVIAALASLAHARRREWLPATLLAVFSLGAFGLAGEEISWGERVFAWGMHSRLVAINEQGETNLHNIGRIAGLPIRDLFMYASFAIAAAGVACALLARRPHGPLRARLLRNLVPPLYTVPGFALMLADLPLALTHGHGHWSQEWPEFCLYLALAGTACAMYLRSLDGRPAVGRETADGAAALMPRQARTTLSAVFAAAVILTLLFAALTVHYGILPGNV